MIVEINGVGYTINQKIENFSVKSMPSSNVAFYGVSHDLGNKQMFVQFKNGSSYIYSNLTDETIFALSECESIGKFVSSQIVNKFPSIKCDSMLVTPIMEKKLTDFQNDLIDALPEYPNTFSHAKGLGKGKSNDLTEPNF